MKINVKKIKKQYEITNLEVVSFDTTEEVKEFISDVEENWDKWHSYLSHSKNIVEKEEGIYYIIREFYEYVLGYQIQERYERYYLFYNPEYITIEYNLSEITREYKEKEKEFKKRIREATREEEKQQAIKELNQYRKEFIMKYIHYIDYKIQMNSENQGLLIIYNKEDFEELFYLVIYNSLTTFELLYEDKGMGYEQVFDKIKEIFKI